MSGFLWDTVYNHSDRKGSKTQEKQSGGKQQQLQLSDEF